MKGEQPKVYTEEQVRELLEKSIRQQSKELPEKVINQIVESVLNGDQKEERKDEDQVEVGAVYDNLQSEADDLLRKATASAKRREFETYKKIMDEYSKVMRKIHILIRDHKDEIYTPERSKQILDDARKYLEESNQIKKHNPRIYKKKTKGILRFLKSHREAQCYHCRKSLSSYRDTTCSSCGWMICECGACGCRYMES